MRGTRHAFPDIIAAEKLARRVALACSPRIIDLRDAPARCIPGTTLAAGAAPER